MTACDCTARPACDGANRANGVTPRTRWRCRRRPLSLSLGRRLDGSIVAAARSAPAAAHSASQPAAVPAQSLTTGTVPVSAPSRPRQQQHTGRPLTPHTTQLRCSAEDAAMNGAASSRARLSHSTKAVSCFGGCIALLSLVRLVIRRCAVSAA